MNQYRTLINFGALAGLSAFVAHLDEIIQGMEQARQFLGDEATDKMMEEVDKMTLFSAITGNAFNKLFGGLLISLVVAGILKKKETPFDQA